MARRGSVQGVSAESGLAKRNAGSSRKRLATHLAVRFDPALRWALVACKADLALAIGCSVIGWEVAAQLPLPANFASPFRPIEGPFL